MNFADKMKIVLADLPDQTEADEKCEDSRNMIDPGAMNRLLIRKELSPLDVINAGIRVIDESLDDRMREDKAFTMFILDMMTTYLDGVVEELFDSAVHIEPFVIEEEEKEDGEEEIH